MSPAPRRRTRPIEPFLFTVIATVLIGMGGALFLAPRPGSRPASHDAEKAHEVDNGSNGRAGQTELTADQDGSEEPATSIREPNFLDLSYCPQGAQCFLVVRPGDLLQIPEGERVIAALGPEWNQRIDEWVQSTGIEVSDVQHVVFSLVASENGPSECVVTALYGVVDVETIEQKQRVDARDSPEGAPTWVVMGPDQQLHDIHDRQGRAPLLRRDLEALKSHNLPPQLVSILFVPTFLVQQAGEEGANPALRKFADSLREVAMGSHAGLLTADLAGNQLVVELRLATAIETTGDVQQRLVEFLEELPNRVAAELRESEPIDPYWHRLAERFPAMLQFTVDQVAIRREPRLVVATVRLPEKAAHNLILATELFLQTKANRSLVRD